MTVTAAPQRLTVVVAAQDAVSTVDRCLAAVTAQRADGIAQIVLVDNSTDGTADQVRAHFSDVEVVDVRGDVLVPALWGEGVMRAREAIVALMTASMAPEPGWAAAVLDTYARGKWAGVGGAILATTNLEPSAAAIYWLRYHRYAGRPAARRVSDIPGDNGSYRREVLSPFLDRIRCEGFWENEINRDLVAEGGHLYSTPAVAVRYLGGESYFAFARQRLIHGRRFGALRAGRATGFRRWALIAAWPLTPVAFLARIVRSAVRAGAAADLVRCGPQLLWLLSCWSLGELHGYLDEARSHPPGWGTSTCCQS